MGDGWAMKFGQCLITIFLFANLVSAAPSAVTNKSSVRVSTNVPVAAVSSNAEWLKHFQLKRGFYMEAVASDLLVANPVGMCFDENGRLYVLEAAQNSAANELSQGRVRLLEDSDGNGIFDTSVIFADNLASPSALICYDGGIFVATGGQIVYLKSSKGSGRAEIRREVFKSFGDAANGNSGQVFISGMAWGLDNRIHVATASRSGDVISSSSPSQSLVLTNGNFSFDPRTFLLKAESGNGVSGMAFDDRGRKFVSSPTQSISMIMYESRYALRNPIFQMPDPIWNLPAGAMANRIYPAPRETSAAYPLPPAVIPFSTSPIPFSAASSLIIYRGAAFPPDYVGDAFMIDAIAGVIHHNKLRQNGLELITERPGDEQGFEFLTVRNNSFQPTQIINGPDGGLYMAGSFLQPVILNPVGKTNAPVKAIAGASRIYRILPDSFKQPVMPNLGTANADRLVMMLRHPNGWYRDTAARLLYERQDRTAIVPLIRLLFDAQVPGLARMHALDALAGIQTTAEGRPGKALMEPHVLKAMSDVDDRVREQGVLLAEEFIGLHGEVSDQIWGKLAGLAADGSPQVRYQLAFTLGQIQHFGRAPLLAGILRLEPDNRWVQSAVLSSFNEDAGEMFGLLSGDGNFGSHKGGEEFLQQLLLMVGDKDQPAAVKQAINDLQNVTDPRLIFNLARGFDNSLQRANDSLLAADTDGVMKAVYKRAENASIDVNSDDVTRIAAMKLLSTLPLPYNGLTVSLWPQWAAMRPALRSEALCLLLTLPESRQTVLTSLQTGFIPHTDLSSVQLKMLLAERDPDLRQLALNVLGNGNLPPRRQVLGNYMSALQLAGDVTRGRELFAANCAICHRLGGAENSLRTSLTNSTKLGKEKILVKILDPNHDVSPNPATVLETGRGERILGFVAGQTSKCIRMLTTNGTERDVARSNIKYQDSLGVSIMPEGMEAVLNQQNVADLLEYLTFQH